MWKTATRWARFVLRLAKGKLARFWCALMACAAALNSVSPSAIPSDYFSGAVGQADQGDGGEEAHGWKAWQTCVKPELVYGKEFPRLPNSGEPLGMANSIP